MYEYITSDGKKFTSEKIISGQCSIDREYHRLLCRQVRLKLIAKQKNQK